MRRPERVSAILDQLAAHGSIEVADVAARLGVSAATIRRDLTELEQQRLLKRTHGGAQATELAPELPLQYKSVRKLQEKRRIAAAAASLLGDATIVGLTGGTTTTEVARLLADHAGLTVITTGLNIAAELVVCPRLRVLIAGGEALGVSLEVVGPIAEQTLSRYHLDIAFIGVDAVDAGEGGTAHDALGAQANQTMVRQARRTIVVADASKLGRVAFSQICRTDQIDTIITDTGADPAAVEALRAAGVQVTLV